MPDGSSLLLPAGIAGLVYYPDSRPGIRRRRAGRGFCYIAPDGTTIDQQDERRRLEAMAVPPAYTDVWMTPLGNGHLMATGLDQRNRKQYRYHPDWSAGRSETKFAQLADFGLVLPKIRRKVQRHLDLDAGEREFALAAAVTLLDRLAIRVGNPGYTEQNGSFGLVTLRRRHMRLTADGIRLDYVAKGGKRVRCRVRDLTLNRLLGKCRELPGAEILGWIDRFGDRHTLSSGAVNDYLAELAGDVRVTAKTFRTWVGTLAAFEVALTSENPTIKLMAAAASERLANTPTVARNSYIHPFVLERPAEAALAEGIRVRGLTAVERRLLGFLSG
jgi:DNA topoisomerase-1